MRAIGPGNLPIPFGHVRGDLGACVLAAASSPDPNINLFAVGQYLSWTEYLRTWCASQGVPYGGYDEASYDEFCELLPGGLGHEFAHNVLFSHEFGYDGSEPGVKRPEDVSLGCLKGDEMKNVLTTVFLVWD